MDRLGPGLPGVTALVFPVCDRKLPVAESVECADCGTFCALEVRYIEPIEPDRRMVCTDCGGFVKRHDNYCGQCGVDLAEVRPAEPTAEADR